MDYKWNKVKIFKLPGIKDLIDITTLSLWDNEGIITEIELVYALILTFHPTVIRDINIIIDKINLKEFIPYPTIRNRKNLVKIITELPISKTIIIENEVNNLLEKYQLTNNWLFPLKIKILTNILPIPGHQEFRLICETDNPKTINYPVYIAIQSKLDSKTRLIDWIDKNFNKVIYPVTSQLTEIKFTKTSASRLAIGLIFGVITPKHNKSNWYRWKYAEKFLNKINNIDDAFFIGKNEKLDTNVIQKLVVESQRILRQFHSF